MRSLHILFWQQQDCGGVIVAVRAQEVLADALESLGCDSELDKASPMSYRLTAVGAAPWVNVGKPELYFSVYIDEKVVCLMQYEPLN